MKLKEAEDLEAQKKKVKARVAGHENDNKLSKVLYKVLRRFPPILQR